MKIPLSRIISLNRRYFLGINFGHNSSVAIVGEDYEVKGHFDIDRLTKISGDHGVDVATTEMLLNGWGVNWRNIRAIGVNHVWHPSDPIYQLANRPLLPKNFSVAQPSTELINQLNSVGYAKINKPLWSKNIPVFRAGHHAAHATSAGWTSPYQCCLTLVLDGMGDGINYSVFDTSSRKIRLLEASNRIPNYAHLWEVMSRIIFQQDRRDAPIGLDIYYPSKGPGKLMALAGLTHPTIEMVKQIKALARDPLLYSTRLDEVVELQRIIDSYLGVTLRLDQNGQNWEKLAPLAAALQAATNEDLTLVFKRIRDTFKVRNLCLAGGLALNCVATSAAARATGLSRVYVPSFSNDSGIAVGAAYLALHATHEGAGRRKLLARNRRVSQSKFSPYLGPKSTPLAADVSEFCAKQTGLKLSVLDNDEVAADTVANLILAGEIVAIYRGRAESGPRALCQRSFLGNVFQEDLCNKMNALKRRESFRPVAPVIRIDDAQLIFEELLLDSPYMTQAQFIKQEFRQVLSGCTHIDGSARPQLVRKHEVFLWRLLSTVKAARGWGVVGNTSLNIKGPIIERWKEVISIVHKSQLVKFSLIDNMLISRNN